jgi:hypothetical protein
VSETRRCPKCDGELTAAAESCPACGLAAAHFESFAAAEAEETPAQLVPLWDACLADWDSVPTHEKFLAAAAALEAVVHAGRLYRRASAAAPTRGWSPGSSGCGAWRRPPG